VACLLLAGLLWAGTAAAQDPPQPAPCPPGLAADTQCWRGQDENGAHLLLARPGNWHGGLVTHVFGGPRMAPPAADTTDEDLLRYAEFLSEGWAWASTSRRRAGFGIRSGGEDALAARRIAGQVLGPIRFSLLHGQSWGGAIAAKAIETLNGPAGEPGPDGTRPWQAALLTSAVLAGPSRAYDMRVDLRAAYQVICATHPRPEEPQYPVTLGLARDQRMTREELMSRYLACTGADLAPEARTEAQRRALADLAAASRVPEAAIPAHLVWATTVFADIGWRLMEGRSAFGNQHVRYVGTSDDAGLNARVPRIAPDPDAAARLAADGDPTGAIAIPVLTLHGTGDMTVFVENQSAYRETLDRAGTGHLLVQVFTEEMEHSKLSGPIYAAAAAALRGWAETRRRPGAAELQGRCEASAITTLGPCRILPNFQPQPWAARVNPR
jgi:alpha-beta hydrolase superfamily lysophospholipase